MLLVIILENKENRRGQNIKFGSKILIDVPSFTKICTKIVWGHKLGTRPQNLGIFKILSKTRDAVKFLGRRS